MKKMIVLVAACMLIASTVFGQAWNPLPMVIDVEDQISYAFDGSAIDIPFSLEGKPALIWLVVNTQLDEGEKPVGVRNGFKGWHFVNGIDTTVYVSSGREYAQGSALTFPWNGQGNEREYQDYQDGTDLSPGTYSYYLVGYDNKSSRENANDFLSIGHYSYPAVNRIYPFDDKTGAVLAQPLLMGTIRQGRGGTSYASPSNTWHRFALGDDPYDVTLIETTHVFGYQGGEIVDDETFLWGAGFVAPDDYDTFYFPRSKKWENLTTIVKYSFVPGGDAVQDTDWGDFENVEWWSYGGSFIVPVIEHDDENIYFNDSGQNPVLFQTDLVRGFPFDDPTDILFDTFLDEFWQPNNPGDTASDGRFVGMVGGMEKGNVNGQFYMSGDATCIIDLIDAHKMIDGATKPFASDGSGYVVWANSNGDWFIDRNAEPMPESPKQLWACQSYEPRNFNNMRSSATYDDMNGFQCAHLEFAGLYSCALFTQDGSGIGLLSFSDDSFSTGGDNKQKKGLGETLDYGGQFDGIYMLKPMQAEPQWGNIEYDGTNWIAWDSDGGTISSEVGPAVEDDAPAAFSVAQNTPNPFNPSTTISFSLARDGQVLIDVYNIAGQKVDTLVNDFMTSGSHSVVWDASGQAAGVYFYTVTSSDFTRTMKMTLLK